MKTLLAVAVVMLATAAFAQDAVVVELSKTDADQAKQLYEAKQAADKAWDEGYKHIMAKYQGFDLGAEFSKDFRFIVPKTIQTITGGGLIIGGCMDTVPTFNTPIQTWPGTLAPSKPSAPIPYSTGTWSTITQ